MFFTEKTLFLASLFAAARVACAVRASAWLSIGTTAVWERSLLFFIDYQNYCYQCVDYHDHHCYRLAQIRVLSDLVKMVI